MYKRPYGLSTRRPVHLVMPTTSAVDA